MNTSSFARRALRAAHGSAVVAPRRLAPRWMSSRPVSKDQLEELMSKFKDPSSPFYLAPGTQGPAHEADHQGAQANDLEQSETSFTAADDTAGYDRSRQAGKAYAQEHGFDTRTCVETQVLWGHQDMFRHVNNVEYGRYFESARINVMRMSRQYLSDQTVNDLMTGTNTGLVVKTVKIDYRRAVTFPDTLAIYSIPVDINKDRASFGLKQIAWSLAQNDVVAKCESLQVMYDFTNLKKGKMTDEVENWLRQVIATRPGAS